MELQLEQFTKNDIVTDCDIQQPSQLLAVKFSSEIEINPIGKLLTPTQASKVPEEIHWNADGNKFYTVVMLDPDAPTRRFAFLRSVLHWMVVNVPGENPTRGELVSSYRGPGPPKFSGLHRYVLLVYEQNDGKADFKNLQLSSIISRLRFSMNDFCTKYKLNPVPVAGNFFNSQAE